MVSIARRAIVQPNSAPQSKLPFVEIKTDDGKVLRGDLTQVGKQFLQRHYNQTAGANRTLPCNSSNAGNKYTLQIQAPSQLAYANYATHDSFGFVAPATSSGLVTALVQTSTGALAEVPVYKNNGAAQAAGGDVVANLHYLLTYVDSLNAGAGGFVIR